MGRFAQFGVAASRLAVHDAGLSITSQNSETVGVSYGTALGVVGDLAAKIFRGFGAYSVQGIPAENVIELASH